jgi:hypothetical protein
MADFVFFPGHSEMVTGVSRFVGRYMYLVRRLWLLLGGCWVVSVRYIILLMSVLNIRHMIQF